MPTSNDADVAAAMQRLWNQYLPQIQERVAMLQSAAESLSRDALSPDLRTSAGSAAHKLAGVLGTFGLEQGTELAREAEAFYSRDVKASPGQGERLLFIASQIRSMIALKK